MMTSRIESTLQRIGYATLLWNRIEDCWYLIFTCLLGETPRQVVDALFRTADTGNKQRSLVLRVAEQAFADASPELSELKDLSKRTDKAATTRNHLLHADFHVSVEDGIADIRVSRGGVRGRPNSLAFKPLAKELDEFLITMRSLDADLEFLRSRLAGVDHHQGSLIDLIDHYIAEGSAKHDA